MTTLADALTNATAAVNANAQQYFDLEERVALREAAAVAISNSTSVANDTTELARAMARGLYVGGLGADPNNLVATIPGGVILPVLDPWVRIRAIALQTNTQAAVTVTVKGIGTSAGTVSGQLKRRDGSALAIGDVPAQAPFEFQSNGMGAFFLIGAVKSETPPAPITTDIIKTVGGAQADFPDLVAATVWVSNYHITLSGSVTFQGLGAAFTYNQNVFFYHPDGARIFIKGAALKKAPPAASTLIMSGADASSRSANTNANLITLRGVYATEIDFVGGFGFVGRGDIGNLQDILFTSDKAAAVDVINWQGGSQKLTNIAAIGGGFRGVSAFGAFMSIVGMLFVLGNTLHGATAEAGGTISLQPGSVLAGLSNGGKGAFANGGTISPPGNVVGAGVGTAFTAGNADDGCNASNGGTLILPSTAVGNSNLGSGFRADNNGYANVNGTSATGNVIASFAASNARMDAQNTGGSGSSYAYQAVAGAFINRTGGTATGTTGAASPPVGQTGNGGALIV